MADAMKLVPVEPTEAMIAALDRGLHEHWPNAREMALGAWAAMLAVSPPSPAQEGVARFRHKVRGTEYTLIGGARLQAPASGLHDETEVVVYQSDEGDLWVRSNVEFWDGRFECISTASPPAREEAPAARRLPICEACDGSGAEDEEAACLICNGTGELGRDANGREAPAEGAGERLRAEGWSVAVHNDYRLNGEPHTFWLWTHPDGQWIKGEGRTDAEALSQCEAALRNRTSEPEAGAVAWLGDGQYEPTAAMIDAGLENCRPGNHANMIASFKAMMQQAEVDGLVITHPAPATADKLRVDDLVRRIRLQVECSSGNLITSGADNEMVRICLSHFNDLAAALTALNEQPQ